MNKKIKPEYEELRIRSISDIGAANLLMENRHYDQAMELSHFSLEKIMKAALLKNGGKPPQSGQDGHNLVKIANVKVGNRKILLSALKNKEIASFWGKIQDQWDVNKRYTTLGLSDSDYDDLFEAYERLIGWIRTKFLD